MDVNDLTYAVIGFAYKIHNTLGAGFIESVYENSLKIELNKIGIFVPKKAELDVFYEGQLVGHFIPDIWIRDTLIVEVKAVQGLSKVHEVQLVNYLTATNIDIGLLINFGPSVEVKRNYRNFKPKQV
jgi:GxxExxY protein